MKRFMIFSISVLCLSFAALVCCYVLTNSVEAQSYPEVDAQAIPGNNNTVMFIMLPDGHVYGNECTHAQPFYQESPCDIGNFWGSGPNLGQGKYLLVEGTTNEVNHYVILSNGDVYGRFTMAMGAYTAEPPAYIGNMYEGIVGTDQSTWGNVKKQR